MILCDIAVERYLSRNQIDPRAQREIRFLIDTALVSQDQQPIYYLMSGNFISNDQNSVHFGASTAGI